MQPGASPITIFLNGEPRQVEPRATVLELLESLSLPADQVAIEWNREILKRPRWAETELTEGAALEIVHFVGGG